MVPPCSHFIIINPPMRSQACHLGLCLFLLSLCAYEIFGSFFFVQSSGGNVKSREFLFVHFGSRSSGCNFSPMLTHVPSLPKNLRARRGGKSSGSTNGEAGVPATLRELQKICPESAAALDKINISSSCGDLHACIRSFKRGRSAGVWAMYENESATAESMIGKTFDTIAQHWALTALRLTNEPVSKEGF